MSKSFFSDRVHYLFEVVLAELIGGEKVSNVLEAQFGLFVGVESGEVLAELLLLFIGEVEVLHFDSVRGAQTNMLIGDSKTFLVVRD